MLLVVMAMMKFLFTWICFQRCFSGQQPEPLQEVEEVKHQGASCELIDSLNVIEYSTDVQKDGGPEIGCAVCLGEFEIGQSLRRLPCSHKFHQGCIDKWLVRRKVCPLCLQDIELEPLAREQTSCCEGKGAHH